MSIDIAIAIILHPTDETVLIAQRNFDVHLADFWEFPGGKCKPTEEPAEAAVRETREEVGLDVDIIEAWPVILHAYPDRTVALHPFLCRARTADAQPLESRRIAWVMRTGLRDYAFPEANTPLIDRLAGSRNTW